MKLAKTSVVNFIAYVLVVASNSYMQLYFMCNNFIQFCYIICVFNVKKKLKMLLKSTNF